MYILAIAAFVIVTTEFLMVGLLPALARDLSISIATAGQLVTLFAIVVMFFGPPLTAWLAHVERKRLFMAILALFAVSNAVAALAPNFWVLAVARIIPALALPVFWGTASETAAQLAGVERAGKAVSTVYLGISAAMLLGIPLGTVAGDAMGWRGAFWVLAIMSLLIAVLLHCFMPAMVAGQRVGLAQQVRILRDPAFVANVLLSVAVFTAMFTGYTYLAELLEKVAHVPSVHVGWWLMGFGAVGLLGNRLGGIWVDRKPLATTALFSVVLAIGMLATVLMAAQPAGLALALGVWGIANTALYPICQIRVMKSAPHAQALAGTINVSAANGGIALGALLGGASITWWDAGSVAVAGAVCAAVAAVAAAGISRWLGKR
ncbi:MFS transporter [Comamonas testosteroni]|uniref:Inner membrane transport protein ydhP n=1 Tax=Comamonas testosteroni TaxID=285 RepID=A0A8B4S6E2_COMTE|nr:MFS transporter [Comamonas testosteroni]EHN65869.1 putative transporter [Comamonas testosteroni ATCC 11996]SUY78108.1 Inner membrane transport protein ydhP [Comamonas testosteroni]